MLTNRPKRNIKPSFRFVDYVCSNTNVKTVSSSTVKVGKDKMDGNGMKNIKVMATNDHLDCNESYFEEVVQDSSCLNQNSKVRVKECDTEQNNSPNDDGIQEERLSEDTEKVNGDCINGEKQGSPEGVKNDAAFSGVKNGKNAEGVVFDEVMVAERSKRWEKTLCGYFVGYSINEGLDHVINNAPWMVSNKPLIVQEWDINMCLDKTKPETVPLWIRMSSVPLEAWTAKGISALESRVGKPMVMDHITATMCKEGMGRFRFARVLVEVSANKPLPNEIEMVYKNGLNNMKCDKRNVREAVETIEKNVNMESNKGEWNKQKDLNSTDNDGFIVVQKKKGRVTSEKVLRPNYKPNTQQQKGGASKQGVMSGKPNSHTEEKKEKYPSKKAWSVHGEILSAMKRSTNKYSVLEIYDENELCELNDIKNKEIVEEFINQKRIPTGSDMLFWNIDMVAYSKQMKEQLSSISKGIVDEKGGTNVEENDVLNDNSGMAECLNVNEMMGMDRGVLIKKFISEESLSVCAIVETHIKAKRIQKIGWNDENVIINMIHSAKQSILCGIKTVNGNKRVLYTIVYAANKAGCSHMTSDMSEFRDRVNNIEMEDISSSGLFYTWTKNLFKVKAGDTSGVLKKLDRITGNEEFVDKFKTIKKLKSLKKDLKKLTWKDQNIFDKVKRLRDQLREVQSKIDKNPNDKQLRVDESKILAEYVEAMKDKEKLLFQKAKVKWLSLGDINNAYFHKVLKSRSHKNKSRINQINDDKGNSFYREEVAEQFVKHLQDFLGNAVQVKDLDSIDSLIKNKLSIEEAMFMTRGLVMRKLKMQCSLLTATKLQDLMDFLLIFSRKHGALWEKIHIQGNILLPQESLKGYDRKDFPNRIAMKIDIQKAYDTLNWQFLEAILKESFGYFKRGRGLRKGDPMSPYLFTLVMEILALIAEKKVEGSKKFKYHFGCKEMKLTHLCFADDLLMFSHGDKEFLMVLKEAI
ncbi:RNA-directed DNA polymerase, eukaryota, reverse transcriptase zinc-binding domain protein [Tanacetum coccineum]